MIPLKTLPDARLKPVLTWLLILANVAAFALESALRWGAQVDVAARYGLVPRCFFAPSSCGIAGADALRGEWLTPLTALFLHADILHLGFNCLFLLVFGSALEGELGHWRWLVCYFLGGLVAMGCHSLSAPFSLAPVIGASGAIAALLGAFLVRLPRAWVLTYVPPIWFLPLPAPLFLVLWLWAQGSGLLGSWSVGAASEGANIAWMAHLGGFGFGAFFGWRTRKRKKSRDLVAAG